jgi:hypothetical protein
MFLRFRVHDPDTLIRAGMLSLILGLFAQLFIHLPTDFWQGFADGVSGVLVGLSIALNLCGLVRRREQQNCNRSS